MNYILSVIFFSTVIAYSVNSYNDNISPDMYECTINVQYDAVLKTKKDTFTSTRLNEIVDHGGAMLGVHVEDMKEESNSYKGVVQKYEDVIGGSVVCNLL